MLSLLKKVNMNRVDTNGLRSPYSNTPYLIRSQSLEELDTQTNIHQWYTILRPLCMKDGNMELTMSPRIIKRNTKEKYYKK